jgi:hypothetical protein
MLGCTAMQHHGRRVGTDAPLFFCNSITPGPHDFKTCRDGGFGQIHLYALSAWQHSGECRHLKRHFIRVNSCPFVVKKCKKLHFLFPGNKIFFEVRLK